MTWVARDLKYRQVPTPLPLAGPPPSRPVLDQAAQRGTGEQETVDFYSGKSALWKRPKIITSLKCEILTNFFSVFFFFFFFDRGYLSVFRLPLIMQD